MAGSHLTSGNHGSRPEGHVEESPSIRRDTGVAPTLPKIGELETNLRFMLQTEAHRKLGQLTSDQKRVIRDLHAMSKQLPIPYVHMVQRILSDLGLSTATPGSVLDLISRGGTVPETPVPERKFTPRNHVPSANPSEKSDADKCGVLDGYDGTCFIILYECAEKCANPVIISVPIVPSNEAIVYVDTRIFSGFIDAHYKQLKDLGIKRVQILSHDNVDFEELTPGFVDLASQRQRDFRSTEVDTDTKALFYLIVLFFVAVIVGHKILRVN